MTSVLHDPWTGATVHDDSLPSPVVTDDANGDYIIHRENGKSTYKAYEGGGSELPEVTADDNGDVLTVVSGEWAKAAPSGGGGGLVVPLTTDGGVTTAGKTAGEIASAVSNGSNVLFSDSEDGGANYYPLAFSFVGEGEYTFAFIMDMDTHTPVYLYASSADDYPASEE